MVEVYDAHEQGEIVKKWLTENGSFVISNGGVEWAATYLVMLLPLFFWGGGRYVSIDYWIARSNGYVTNKNPAA